MGSIKRLPDSVHSIVRSSIILFDLPRVVEELIYNSIDAGCTKVDVSVNVKSGSVKVTDDGCGITRDGLVLLGEKYVTSKHYPVADLQCGTSNLGFKGETLGSLSDISLVEIRTKARGWPNAYCKIMKGSKCIFMGIDDKREGVGTTVTVRELFYNQPVRRRCMQSSPKRELHSVKKCILQIALVHPQISFRLYDIESEDELLCTVPSSSPLPLISEGFGKDVSICLHKIFHSDQPLTLSGFISGPCGASLTKDLQYLYINSRFVRKNPIHNLITNLATHWQSPTYPNRDEPKAQSRKRSKAVAYPAFLLNLCCPSTSYDLNYEPSKTVVEFKDLNVVLAFFERAVTSYWKVMPDHPLEEAYHAENTSLSLEREILKEERQKTLMSERRKKPKVACHKISPMKSTLTATDPSSSNQRKKKTGVSSYRSTPIKSVLELTTHNGLYETPINSSASFLNLNPCTGSTSHSHWSMRDPLFHREDEYPPMSTPMVGANYKTIDPSFKGKSSVQSLKEDKPILRACSRLSRESSYCMENENPRKVYMSHYMELHGSSEDYFNSEIYCSADKMYSDEYGGYSTLWDSPGACMSDLWSLQKDCFFDSPFWSSTGSYQNRRCTKKRKLMEEQDEFFETSRDLYSGSPLLSCKKALWGHDFSTNKSQFFEFRIGKAPISPHLDSLLIEKEKESHISFNEKDFPLLVSPIVKTLNWGHVPEELLEEQKLQHRSSGSHHKVTLKPRRSFSAPPFYKGKCKYSHLNDQLTTLTGKGSTSHFSKTTTDAKTPVPNTTREMHLSQPWPDPAWSETLQLNLREKKSVETAYVSPPCQRDYFEHTGDELTKWRVDSVQPTVVSSPLNSIDDILNISSGLLQLSSTSLIPESIDRNCLENAKVLLQLDKKFIPVIARDTLVILDQHAADERIRLEDLRRKVLSGEGWGSTFLNLEEELVLPEMGFQLLEKYGEQIKKWGWLTSIDIQSSDPFKKSMNLLKRHEGHNNSVISVVAVPCILGTNLTSKDLLEFLDQLVETDGSGNLPSAVVRILNLKACRGAIMFGDPLLPSECSLILEELKATSLCFQCAHGRPTTVPLLNIKNLHVELEKIKMQNVGPANKWHGLTHHKLSVEYAQHRLNREKM